jgi:hypothetical protein
MALFDDTQPLTGQRLQLLKMAHEILFNEYIDKKAQLHNQWSAESEIAWRRGIRVPYPSFPPYPNHEEIMRKAIELDRFLNAGSPKLEENQKTVKTDTQQPVENIKEPIIIKEVEPEVVEVKAERASIVPEILEKNDYFTDIGNTEPTQNNQSIFSGFFSRK